MLPKINSVFYWSFVVNVKWMTIMKDIKLCESWKVGNELSLFDGVCKYQKWVENANQTQLKPIIWYPSWYFSRGGGEKWFPPPYRILIYAPVPRVMWGPTQNVGPIGLAVLDSNKQTNRQTKTFVFSEAFPFSLLLLDIWF